MEAPAKKPRLGLKNLSVDVGFARQSSFCLTLEQGLATFQYHAFDARSGQHETLTIAQHGKNGFKSTDMDFGPELGRGEGGGVRIVYHKPTQRKYALKETQVLDRSTRHQLERELLTYRAIGQHDNVVQLFDVYYEEGRVNMVLELMTWGSMETLLSRQAKTTPPTLMTEPVLAALSTGVLRALKFLHDDHNIVHRDIKPGNVMLHENGAVKLSDFGTSASGHNAGVGGAGTLGYMSPERLEGTSCSKQSDMWALGIMAMECALGKHPYLNKDGPPVLIELYTAVVVEEPPSAAGLALSEEFKGVIHACIDKKMAQRPDAAVLLRKPLFAKCDAHVAAHVSAWLRRFGKPVRGDDQDDFYVFHAPTPRPVAPLTPRAGEEQCVQCRGVSCSASLPCPPSPPLPVSSPTPPVTSARAPSVDAAEPSPSSTATTLTPDPVSFSELSPTAQRSEPVKPAAKD